MSDQHSEGMPDQQLTVWKYIIYAVLFISTAVTFLSFRKLIVGTLVRLAAYVVWSLNMVGSVIPQVVLWVVLLVLLLYIAVGSFYGKGYRDPKVQRKLEPSKGPVEARAKWIEERAHGTYFKWRLANLLGRVHQDIQKANQYEISRNDPAVPLQVQEYLNAGLNTSFADYSLPKFFQKRERTALDADLEQVVDYLEEQLEIKDEL